MTTFALQHKKVVVGLWVLLAAFGALTLKETGGRWDYTYTTPGQPGYVANLHILDRFGMDAAFEPTLAVLRLPPREGMGTAAGRALAARTFAAAPRAGLLAEADYATTGNPIFELDGGRTTWALIDLPNPDKGPGVGVGEALDPILERAAPPGTSLTLTGFAQMLSNAGPNGLNLLDATLIGAVGAFLVLLVVYGSAIAIVPILMALPAILVTFLCALGLTYVTDISYFIQYLIALLSLGVAIDFSLVVVTRWREERERGAANDRAVLAASRSAGRAVMLSGLTAAVGLLSLVLLPVPFLRSIGFGGMLIPLIAVIAAVTLLPVTLAAWGPALDKFCLWPKGATTFSRPWERWGRFVLRHRWVAACAGLAILIVLALPTLRINTAEPLAGSLSPKGPAAAAFADLGRNGIPSAVDFPLQVVTHGGAAAVHQATAIARATPGIYAVISPDTPSFRRGDDALLTIVPTAEGSTVEGKAIVTRLRERLAAIRGGAEVGGSTAADMSFTDAVYGNFPLLLAFVSAIMFAILTRALRSVVLAIKAVILNVVSLGAAYGFMVFFWQEGHGSRLYGVPATGAIRDWIPVVVFASLFGLSMDYEVFVLARIREEYDRLGSTDAAIVAGLARTGRLVTCAALILMVSFLSLSTDPNQLVKIVSTTLAFGIVIDAVVTRTLLVPALVSLLGRWNWWLPRRLGRLIGIAQA